MQQLHFSQKRECHRAYLPLDLSPEADFALRNNNSMVPHLAGSNSFPARAFIGDYPSQEMIVAGDPWSGRYVLAGALSARRSQTNFMLRKSGRFIGIDVEQPHIRPGEEPEKLLVLEGGDWRELVERYADAAAREMGVAPISPACNFTGYCTWYYYYSGVCEKDLMENVDAIAGRQTTYRPAYIQIDDGYQPFIGDWLERRSDWPTPLSDITKKIRARGFGTGIWLTPLMASTASRCFREHSDWFVRNSQGEPYLIRGWSAPPDTHWGVLDGSRTEVCDYLANLFRTLQAWGFDYIKMDGLGLGLPEGSYHDPAATPVSAYRQAMTAIRNAVPNAVLLGCGAPFLPSVGLIDHCRVSSDTSRYYEVPRSEYDNGGERIANDIRSSMHLTMAHWWKFDRWFRADPDALMARQDNAFYTYGEAKISVLCGILTGVCTTSDHFGTIAQNRLALLERAAKYRVNNVRPWEWKTSQWPQIFSGRIDGRRCLAIFNDSETEQTFHFADYRMPEHCEDLLEGDIPVQGSILLPRHDAALIAEII